jgi:serine/threonine protein kinase
MRFSFRSGQQPLAGFTIKRGVGTGSFGEVYFAVSDGGKEVALKWIRTNLDIELRGVQQCLNLKHLNLVHLYDLRRDLNGNYWLVMEFVSGDSLASVIARHPNGMDPHLASGLFDGIAQGMHYLHDSGIIHRDLKPGNIFLDNGVIKIGDFGLCRALDSSHHVGMTKGVGTPIYMAPETKSDKYKRQVDLYAAGVILFEMLTGRPPFEKDNAEDLAMAHRLDTPDLSRIPVLIRPVLKRALAKDPAERFESFAEMNRALGFAVGTRTAPLAKPVSPPSPTQTKPVEPILVSPAPPPNAIPTVLPVRATMIDRWAKLSGTLLLSVAFAALLALGWTLFLSGGDWASLTPLFFLVLASSWTVLIPSNLWPVGNKEESWSRRLLLMTLGFGVGLVALWLQGYQMPWPWLEADELEVLWPWSRAADLHPGRWFYNALYHENRSMPILACYLSYFGLAFLVLRWWKTTEEKRPKRFSLKPVFAVGFWSFVLLVLLPTASQRYLGFSTLVLTAILCQLVSPWLEVVAVKRRKVRLEQVRAGGR